MRLIENTGGESMSSEEIIDIRFHGRGGQGVVTASRITAEAAILERKYTHAFPSFGPERSGAPIAAFTRISEQRIVVKTQVYEPDIIVIVDPTLLGTVDVFQGLKPKGQVIVNFQGTWEELRSLLPRNDCVVSFLDGTAIAKKYIDRPIANTVVLGALAKMTDVVKLESIIQATKKIFAKDPDIAEKNVAAIKKAAEEVIIP